MKNVSSDLTIQLYFVNYSFKLSISWWKVNVIEAWVWARSGLKLWQTNHKQDSLITKFFIVLKVFIPFLLIILYREWLYCVFGVVAYRKWYESSMNLYFCASSLKVLIIVRLKNNASNTYNKYNDEQWLQWRRDVDEVQWQGESRPKVTLPWDASKRKLKKIKRVKRDEGTEKK